MRIMFCTMSPRRELRAWMRRERLTQTTAAERLGCHQTTVSRLLAGKQEPDPALRERIAAVAGVEWTTRSAEAA